MSSDSGYPLELWLLTPILGSPAVQTPEAEFNKRHCFTRSILERCIGMLKNRFRCLQRYHSLHCDPDRARNIATACAILHNVYSTIPEPSPKLLVSEESDSESDSSDSDTNTRSLKDRCSGNAAAKSERGGCQHSPSTARTPSTARAPSTACTQSTTHTHWSHTAQPRSKVHVSTYSAPHTSRRRNLGSHPAVLGGSTIAGHVAY